MEGTDRRKYQRFRTEDQSVHASIASARIVKIMDISIGGSRLQTDVRLNMFNEYTIRFEHNGKYYPIKGSIVWSVLKECKSDRRGNSIPIYQSGIKFSHIPDEFMSLVSSIGKNQKQEENNAGNGEEYYSLSIEGLDMSSKDQNELETYLGSLYGQ